MTDLSDGELMQRYQLGEEPAFSELYRRYSPRVYGYLRKRITNRDKADEVLQSVFLKLHRSRQQYDATFPFVPWLFMICRSVMIDSARQGKIFDEARFTVFDENIHDHASEEPPPGNGFIAEDTLAKLGGAKLSSDRRIALQLRYFDGLSYEQIAERLRITEESARQRVSRAIRSLKKTLKGEVAT